ncbi:MAG: UMP kinase [Deltaproteobacteria bacterium]|nr:UMP kinase [Deltaproteobacteria bacterium]
MEGYKRILLKLSGEALAGKLGHGIDHETLSSIALSVKEVHETGTQIGVVIGGGNIFRGLSSPKFVDQVYADYMGMLATVINALALQGTLDALGSPCRTLSAIEMKGIAEPFIRRRAIKHLEKGRLVIFAGGTGNPFFTTDTAAALRAMEIGADVLIKATRVDGIYNKDPEVSSDAILFKEIDYDQALAKDLKFMDATAISLCRDNNLEIRVINISDPKTLKKAIKDEAIGSIVRRRSVHDKEHNG